MTFLCCRFFSLGFRSHPFPVVFAVPLSFYFSLSAFLVSLTTAREFVSFVKTQDQCHVGNASVPVVVYFFCPYAAL